MKSLQEYEEEPPSERKVDVMEAACVVSLGGAAKTHLLDILYKMVDGLGAPKALQVNEKSPLRRQVSNFSSLAMMAKQHQKMVYCPGKITTSKGPAILFRRFI